MKGIFVVACVLTLGSIPSAELSASAQQPSVAQVGLEPNEVPGFSTIDRSVQTYQDPTDAGVDQAFISCAGSTPLLSEFDQGGDSTISQVYGQGDNGFGAPALSVASVVFGSNSASDVDAAYAQLASASFQQCWLTTIDSLNIAQGSVTPMNPSTLSSLTMPQLGSARTGFVMHWDVSVGSSALTGQFGVSVVETGPYVVALFTLAWGTAFPDATRTSVLEHFVGRISGAASKSGTSSSVPAIQGAKHCIVTMSSDAHVTGAQRQIDLSKALATRPLTLHQAALNQDGALNRLPNSGPGGDEPGAAANCEWFGATVTPRPPFDFSHDIDVNLSIVPWATSALAKSAFDSERQRFPSVANESTISVGDAFLLPQPRSTGRERSGECAIWPIHLHTQHSSNGGL